MNPNTGKIYYGPNGWQYWYDYNVRCWYCAKYDAEGNQVGDAMDAYTKREIKEVVEMYKNEDMEAS